MKIKETGLELAKLANIADLLIVSADRKDKILARAATLRDMAKDLDAEGDKTLLSFIKNVKSAKDDIKSKRMPFTRRLDEIKKRFTGTENEIDAIVSEFSGYRDSYAKKVLKEREAANNALRLKEMQEREAVQCVSDVSIALGEYINERIADVKGKMLASLKQANPDNVDEKIERVSNMKVEVPKGLFKGFTFYQDLKHNDFETIRAKTVAERKEKMMHIFHDEIDSYRQECLYHLRDFKKTNFGTKDRAIKEHQDKIAASKQASNEVNEVQAGIEKNQQIAEIAFNAIEPVDTEQPNVRVGYEIKILERGAYAALVAYWFSTIGKDYDEEKFSRKTIGSMIKDLEKYAYSTGEKLDYKGINYESKVKAVNR